MFWQWAELGWYPDAERADMDEPEIDSTGEGVQQAAGRQPQLGSKIIGSPLGWEGVS